MKSLYQEFERERGLKLLKGMSPLYYGGTGGNHFMGSERDFVLKDYKKNFYQPIMLEAIAYFKNNGISWWGGKNPTGHILSSQIACINHLYPIRNDKEAVLGLLRIISPDFVDVLQISTDKQDMGYIQFESVSDYDYLNEGQSTRGSNCTSVDALIYAVHKNGSNWLIPIEWKYTEHYSNMNKADEGCKKDPQNCKGKVRRSRYTDLINGSDQLKGNDHYCYYFEPFYQLMRQTLWAEQMVRNKTNETIKADDYLHVHVIPSENKDLLTKKYKCSNLGMEETWREHLVAQKKYKIISPYDLLSSIVDEGYDDLFTYLNGRYWNGS